METSAIYALLACWGYGAHCASMIKIKAIKEC